MLHQRTLPELIRTAKALQTKAEQAQGKAEQFWVSLGLTLAELKERKPKDITWPVFVRRHFPFGKARADELIRIGVGTTSVAAVRAQRETSRMATRSSQSRNTAAGAAAHALEQIAQSPIAAAAAQAASERSAAKRAAEPAALNMQVNTLVGKLDDFIDGWSEDVNVFWAKHQSALEKDGGKDCLMHFMETSAMKLWRLAQALDGREPQGDEHE